MCGIVGYLGASPAAKILLSELRCLEYRGYDSAGVAVIEDGKLAVLKAAGKLSNLEELIKTKQPLAKIGIGHTRWATHGVPNDQNAHPHMDCTNTLAVVHNGIIENYEELREDLTKKGHDFKSDTDTEVVSHLIEEELKAGKGILFAIEKAVGKLKGAYALGIVCQDIPDKIFAVNQHYSLAVGLGENESFLASDSIAVSQYTNKVLRLEQSEIAEITKDSTRLYTFDGKEIKRSPISVDAQPYILDKQGHKHFLLKEIHEQPLVLRKMLSKYLPDVKGPVNFAAHDLHVKYNGHGNGYGVYLNEKDLAAIKRIKIIACGTAYHAGLIGQYIIEQICGIPVDVDIASEARSKNMLVDKSTLTIAVSQSGETADTLAALTQAKEKGSIALGITNRADSHLAHLTPHLIVTECGVEVSVAATKTFTAQLLSFYLLAIFIAETRNLLPAKKITELKKMLTLLPAQQEKVLSQQEYFQQISLQYAERHDMLFIGRGISFPVALEGALKLKELSYIHASGYAAGELKHGPIAVLDSQVPVVTILVPGAVYEKTLSNAQEAKARKAQMIAVTCENGDSVRKLFDSVMYVPPTDELVSPMLTVIPLQLMSYFIADYLGKDVDQPRNLAKSVTVE
jgi:glucosamine--fructose-6-phosphate aminotransferase (isomerizing)